MKKKQSFAGLNFVNTYAKLPKSFYVSSKPTAVSKPVLLKLNHQLAQEFGLDVKKLTSKAGVNFCAGNYIPEGAEPIATAYAGHQFGNFTPKLGDGRAVLLGGLANKKGQIFDLQLKGSGQTPFSRRGDGRSALGPVIREYLMSEAMYALGIKTTRALAMVASGEEVVRDKILPGGIFTRIASSHIRVGTFQYFAAQKQQDELKKLADYTIKRHYATCNQDDNPYLALLREVIAAQTKLIVSWIMKGFIHGVMNTDNMSICGETIDYGPCAFLDTYKPDRKFSAIDYYGRYAYANQPNIAAWNLTRFADAIITLLDNKLDKAILLAKTELEKFPQLYQKYWLIEMRKKFGLITERADDVGLFTDYLNLLEKHQADFHLSFRSLCYYGQNNLKARNFHKIYPENPAYKKWYLAYDARLKYESSTIRQRQPLMLKANPAYIPRNHLVEEVIWQAVKYNDFSYFEKLHKILAKPYNEQQKNIKYMLPAEIIDENYQTFCGT